MQRQRQRGEPPDLWDDPCDACEAVTKPSAAGLPQWPEQPVTSPEGGGSKRTAQTSAFVVIVQQGLHHHHTAARSTRLLPLLGPVSIPRQSRGL
jgi:hypothetical protein